MKTVAIFQHDQTQGPGYLREFLDRRDIPYEIFHPAEGDAVPTNPLDHSGLVFLGSNQSVNDGLSWIEAELQLIRTALRSDRPVLGHCFGGQLLARALGASVMSNPHPHIGWGRVMTTAYTDSREWFGEAGAFNAFHWHYQSFTLPAGARRVLYGQHSLNKGFSAGKHLGLQCHLEITEATLRSWCAAGAGEISQNAGDTVENIATIFERLPQKLAALHRVADRVYSHWTEGLVRPARIMTAINGWQPERQLAFIRH